MPTTPARRRLRDLLAKRELIVAPGVFDGISAQRARRTGHVAAYLTGAGVAASGFGLPDIGLVTQTEMTERARMMVAALGDVPLIADADTGYGAPLNVVRTVRQYNRRTRNFRSAADTFPTSGSSMRRHSNRRSPRPLTPAPTTTCSSWRAPTRGHRSGWMPPSRGRTGTHGQARTSSLSRLRRASTRSSGSHARWLLPC